MRKWNHAFNTLLLCLPVMIAGVWLSAYTRFRSAPEAYEQQSAPWYAGALVASIPAAVIVAILLIVKIGFNKRNRQHRPERSERRRENPKMEAQQGDSCELR